jgi:caffeoyl-CoA O-methyltransferase
MADRDSRAGLSYATREILDWLARTHAPHDTAAARAFDAPAAHGMPAIQLGASEAKAVALLLRLAGATEGRRGRDARGVLGARHGARAAGGRARLDGRVRPEARARRARKPRERRASGRGSRSSRAPASTVLPTLEPLGPFDAVFVDADKRNYDGYGRWAARNVRKGGLLIGDNAFLFGRLLEDSEEAAAMRRFHEEAAETFDTACLPTPDGMLVGLKR